VGLLSLACLVMTASGSLAQESTPTPTPTPPSPTDLPNGGETTVTVEKTPKASQRQTSDPETTRPPGSGDSTGNVPPEVPEPTPTPTTDCEPFEYSQTYRNWGPASAYGRKVSVLYDADRCVRIENGVLRISMEGTAEVREGRGGKVIGERPFELEGTWVHPSITEGWPPDWWQCGVADLDYSWRIAGRYSFEVEAEDGRWALDVITARGGKTRTVHWTYDACR
jgi:hypothetical protein